MPPPEVRWPDEWRPAPKKEQESRSEEALHQELTAGALESVWDRYIICVGEADMAYTLRHLVTSVTDEWEEGPLCRGSLLRFAITEAHRQSYFPAALLARD